VLLHGRGADEHDLFPLLDVLDPDRRLLGITPRGPFTFPPGGAHWYALREVGYPDPRTFHQTFPRLAEWLDGLGLPVVLGGFSQGAVMAYALALGKGRPSPVALIALSGFVPTVEGFELDLESRAGLPVAIGHGTYDDVIRVELGRQARDLLEGAGADVLYRESPLPHAIDPDFVRSLSPWLGERFRTRAPGGPAPDRRD
jgi:phospholipase/carboxylesterase